MVLAPTAVTPAPTTEPAPVVAAVPVTRIQTVPAVRDVIIEVDGRQMATDASGAITLTGADSGGTLRVVGTVADPPVQTVEFATWGDGSPAPERLLGSLDGPVAQVGLLVRSRVVLRSPEPTAAGTTASFTSNAGVGQLPLDEPTWVPAAFAAPTADGLTAVDATYALEALSDGRPTVAQVFRPTPEATWRSRRSRPWRRRPSARCDPRAR